MFAPKISDAPFGCHLTETGRKPTIFRAALRLRLRRIVDERQEPGDVYIGNPAAFEHGLEYDEATWERRSAILLEWMLLQNSSKQQHKCLVAIPSKVERGFISAPLDNRPALLCLGRAVCWK